jgi:hypothetical protein
MSAALDHLCSGSNHPIADEAHFYAAVTAGIPVPCSRDWTRDKEFKRNSFDRFVDHLRLETNPGTKCPRPWDERLLPPA